MADKSDLANWIVEALQAKGGAAPLVEVCRHVWEAHENDLRDSGDLFYTWQYVIRWSAHLLNRNGMLLYSEMDGKKVWKLSSHHRASDA